MTRDVRFVLVGAAASWVAASIALRQPSSFELRIATICFAAAALAALPAPRRWGRPFLVLASAGQILLGTLILASAIGSLMWLSAIALALGGGLLVPGRLFERAPGRR